MPIKFRCSYCRQFLGISRGRAGEVVDCPTCGRSIRVPGLDGVIAPMPSPELNLRDARLTRALDELAQWDAPQPVPTGGSAVAESELEAEEEIPQPIAEPIPIEVPVAPEPIAVKPPPSLEPQSPGGTARLPDGMTEPALNVAAAIEELAQMSAGEAVRRPNERPSFDETIPRPATSQRSLWIITTLLALMAFAGGYFISSIRHPVAGSTESSAPALPNPGAAAAETAPAISGRITYKTPAGESLPDRGARILILPREREGTAKLSAIGLRAADHPADVRLAQAALRSLGGDLALTDDGGKFAVQLPNPGTFQIIVVSNYASRDAKEELDPELLRQMTPYFEQPSQVLGRTKVHFGQVRYKGIGTEGWDHSF